MNYREHPFRISMAAITILTLPLGMAHGAESPAAQPPAVIFDTDMGSDCDDAGALAVLHALADAGELRILGVIFSSGKNRYGVGTCDAINTYYGRGDLPLGQYQGSDVGDPQDTYTKRIATDTERFGHDIVDDAPDLVAVYRSLLESQPDRSVTICTVGHPHGLVHLLRDPRGTELVRAKVDRWVAMGTGGWNFKQMGMSAYNRELLEKWPRPFYISPSGRAIETGHRLLPGTPETNPVREAYRLWGEGTAITEGRSSWDQVAVLFVARPELFTLNHNGRVERLADGNVVWNADVDDPRHRLVIPKPSTDEMAGIIEELMTRPPKAGTSPAAAVSFPSEDSDTENPSRSRSLDLKHREALMWRCEEWTLENASWSGNPFDVIATVTFVHSPSNEQRTTRMFHAGDNWWKFRFTGTRTGGWNFSTSSRDAELDGHTGTVTVGPRAHPGIKGFLTHVGNKYALMQEDIDHLQGYVYQVFMNQQDYEQQHEHASRILGHPSRADLIPEYWKSTRENGFDIYFFAVFYSWFRMGALSIDDFSGGADPDLDEPDPALFDRLELAINHAHERGGRTHIWAWGDNDRKQTPNHVGDGFRGERHRRLIRYIAARLGPLPGWSMNFGFDTIEMPNAETDAAWWADEMNRTMGWPHILSSRGWHDQSFGAWSYAGFGGNPYDLETTDKGPADYDEIRRHLEAHTHKPSLYEERHTYNRWRCWPGSVPDPDRLDETGCRRLIWWEIMAGGMGGFFGHFSERFNQYGPFRPEGPCGYHPESLKRAFRTHRDFWRNGRLRLDMLPDNTRVRDAKGYCLADSDRMHFVFFVEDAASVTVDLSGMPGSQPVIAVDAKARYQELDRGKLMTGVHTIRLGHTSDWVFAVGDFRAR